MTKHYHRHYHRRTSVGNCTQQTHPHQTSQPNGLPKYHKKHTKLAELQIIKPEDTKQIRPIDTAALKLLQDPDDTHMYVNELMKSNEDEQTDENLWFPTPENPGNEEEHTPIQRRILKEIRELIKKELLDSTKDKESRQQNLGMFHWEGSQSEGDNIKQLEGIVVEYNNTLRFTDSTLVPSNFKEDLSVELALMHQYGKITTLPFSKYANPIFAQRKRKVNCVYLSIYEK